MFFGCFGGIGGSYARAVIVSKGLDCARLALHPARYLGPSKGVLGLFIGYWLACLYWRGCWLVALCAIVCPLCLRDCFGFLFISQSPRGGGRGGRGLGGYPARSKTLAQV